MRVKWLGYEECTWEPCEMILQDLPELVASYFEVHRLMIVEGSTPRTFKILPIQETPKVKQPEEVKIASNVHGEVKFG